MHSLIVCYIQILSLLTAVFSGEALDRKKNITLEEWKNCYGENSSALINVTFEIEDGYQYATGNFNVVALNGYGMYAPVTVSIESNVRGRMIHIVTVKARNACTVIYSYFKSLSHALESSAGIKVGICPLPHGLYFFNRVYLDLDSVPLLRLPKGKFRAIIESSINGRRETCFNVSIVSS